MRREKKKKKEERLRNLWDNFKCSNIWFIGVPEEEEEQELKTYLKKIIKEDFPNLVKELDMQVQEAQNQRSWIQGETHQDTS